MHRKNRLFAKYGHECEISHELDILPTLYPGTGIMSTIKRTMIRLRIVSEINTFSSKFLRSQGAIAEDKRRHLTTHPMIIHPFSDFRTAWEFFMIFVLTCQFIMIPIDIAYFRLDWLVDLGDVFKWTRMIFDLLCCVDLCLNFFTGYYDHSKKQVMLEPRLIQGQYFRTYFIFDFLSAFPAHTELIFELDANSWLFTTLQYLSILKILRFFSFVRYCYNLMEIMNIPFAIFKIVLVVSSMIFFIHIISCTFITTYALGKTIEGGTARIDYDSEEENIPSLIHNGSYTGAFLLSTIIFSNSGYGIAPPHAALIKLMMAFFWLISRVIFIVILSVIMQVVQTNTSSSHKYIEMVRQLREYMRYKQLPEHMQRRLLCYYEFRFQKSYFRENEILLTISSQLRQEIVMHSCRKLVENVSFFRNLPLNLLVRIVSCMRQEIFLVNDVIIKAYSQGDCMYFIGCGTVAVYTPSGREICHLYDGDHFGEIALIMKDERRIASVVGVETCELYRLQRNDFVRAIHPYPDLLDSIQKIAGQRMEKTEILDEHHRRETANQRNLHK